VKASVIVPTRNRGEPLLETLRSIVQQTYPSHEFEVIVVDSSSDKTRAIIEEYISARTGFPEIRMIREDRLGVHYARHSGARAMLGEIYVQIEDDAVARQDWLAQLLEAFQQTEIVCAGGRVLPRFERAPPVWMKDFYGLLTVYDLGEEPVKGAYVTACNIAVRRDALFAVGGFNPDIVGRELVGNGEVGLIEKLKRAGIGETIYVPNAIVWHCIPAQRLTMEYMRWRNYHEGTCPAQNLYQATHPKGFELIRLALNRASSAGIHKGLSLLNSAWGKPSFYQHEFTALNHWRQALYFFQIATDRSFREFASREDWIWE
jgi:glucosyl-dolichyl phosphate glucuronosyltransferase